MKNVTNMDGETQTNFLDAPVIDCSFLPSKKALQYRFNQTTDLIIKGDLDFARYRNWEGLTIKQGDRHLRDMVKLTDGWWSMAQVKGIQRFMATWEARRAYLMDDCRDLQRSIELAE